MGDRNCTMSLCKPLPKEVRSLVRSGIAITNVAQCVEELVLNSLDAKATTIYVGVNLDNFSVRVEDNGIGLSKQDLETVGTRYTTSKCHCLEDLNVLRYYGYRGEALASIINVSASVELIGRVEDAVAPYKKRYVKGKSRGSVDKQPESRKKTRGLNVIIGNLLSELPVRQKRIEKSIQLEEIKATLQRIVLINPSLSIEFRNDSNGSRLLEYSGCPSFAEAFRQLYGTKSGLSHINLIEEHHLHKEFFFTGCIAKETYKTKSYQLVYVNKRYISRGKIHRHLNDRLSKILVGQKDKYPIFIVNIKCPLNVYDCTLDAKKLQVEFREWEPLAKGIDGFVACFQSTLQSTDKGNLVRRSFAKDERVSRAIEKRRKSECNDNEDEEDEFGQTVTTHDVKRAIHSRFAVRENIMEGCSDVTSKNSFNIQKSQETSSSGLIISIDSLQSEVKPKASQAIKRKSLKPRQSKTTTYDLRILNANKKRENIFPSGPGQQKHRIYVPRKPRMNAAVFKKFPQWAPANGSHNSPHSNSSQALSPVSEVPEKRSRKMSLEEQFGYKKKPGYSQVQERISAANQKKLVENEEPGKEAEEVAGYHWKLERFLKECNAQAPEVLDMESPPESKSIEDDTNDIISISSMKLKSKASSVVSKPDKSTMDDDVTPTQNTSSENGSLTYREDSEAVEVPDDYTWAINVLHSSIDKNADNFLFNGTTGVQRLKGNVREYLMSSEKGSDILKQLEGPGVTKTNNKTEIMDEKSSTSLISPTPLPAFSANANVPPAFHCGFNQSQFATPWLGKPSISEPIPIQTPDPFGLTRSFPLRSSAFAKSSNADPAISSLKSTEQATPFQFVGLNPSTRLFPQPRTAPGLDVPLLPSLKGFNANPFGVPKKQVQFKKPVVNIFNHQPFMDSSGFINQNNFGYKNPVMSTNSNVFNPEPSFSEYFKSSANDRIPFRNPVAPAAATVLNLESSTSEYFRTQDSSNETSTASSLSAANFFSSESSGYFESEEEAAAKKPIVDIPEKNVVVEEEEEWGEWEVDIVSDSKGQDWLQTEDDSGKLLYINLATGVGSYDMINIIMGTKISAGEAAKRNKNFRYDWLRRYFPRGSHKFWKPEESKVKIQLEGNVSLVQDDNVLGKVVVDCIKGSFNEESATKWKDGVMDSFNREHNSEAHGADGIRLTESWNRPVGLSEVPVANLNALELKFWNKLKGNVQSSFRFAKQDLARVKVLTQLDKKFIVAKVSTLSTTEKITDVLVMFDQHAVHERVRLEQFLEESYVEGPQGQKEIRRISFQPMPLNFSETEVRIMQSYKEGFDTIGVKIEVVNSTSVKVSSAPKCFVEKVSTESISNHEPVMRKLLSSLLQEQVHHIIDTKGSFQAMPKTIFNILCSQACHGAIKFGDELELAVCQKLILQLKDCKTPFQCAHGRPVLVPLLDLASLKNATDVPLSMTHNEEQYDYTTETPNGTIERVSSQEQKESEADSNYFNNSSSGYFSYLNPLF